MMPQMMEITTKIGCKMNCRFCPQGILNEAYYKLDYCPQYMTFDVYKKCIDKIPENVDIHFSGMCEPWLNRECTKMVKYAHYTHHRIHVYTTLVGMKEDDYFEIKKIPFSRFVIHIPDENDNSHFDLNEDYRQLLKLIVDDHRKHEFIIDSFSCHGIVNHEIQDIVYSLNLPINSKMYDRAGNVTEKCDISQDTVRDGNIICKWCGGIALSNNVLLPNGLVVLCCMDYKLNYPLGNLLETSYSDVCEGRLKKTYREMMTSNAHGNIICRRCYRSESIDIK